ncbi:hypothetical protein THAOC_17570, partial [Thalassiosira oceanica]
LQEGVAQPRTGVLQRRGTSVSDSGSRTATLTDDVYHHELGTREEDRQSQGTSLRGDDRTLEGNGLGNAVIRDEGCDGLFG